MFLLNCFSSIPSLCEHMSKQKTKNEFILLLSIRLFISRMGFGVAKPARRQVYCLQFWTVRWFACSLAGWQEWDMCMYADRRMRCFISLFFNVSWFLYFHFNSFQFNSNSTYLFIRLLLLLTPSPFSRWYLHIDDDAAATATAKSNSRKNTIIVNDNNILVNSIELPFPLRHPSSLPPSAVRLCIEFAMFCWRFYFSSAW